MGDKLPIIPTPRTLAEDLVPVASCPRRAAVALIGGDIIPRGLPGGTGMANRAYLYSDDRPDAWDTPGADYYDSRWTIPLAWF